MDATFTHFMAHLHECAGIGDIRDALFEMAHDWEIEALTYMQCPRNGQGQKPEYLTDYRWPQGWIQRYCEAGYFSIDPRVKKIAGTMLPFAWGTSESLRDISDSEREMFEEAEGFGIRYFYTFPVHMPRKPIAWLTVGSSGSEKSFLQSMEQRSPLLLAMAIHMHERASRYVSMGGTKRLSPRELQCLELAAAGKTRRQIAELLGLTMRTAVFHLENAKRKLATNSTAHAIAKAHESGLL